MPKLVYDYQVFLWQPYGGISRYIYEIATRMTAFQDFDVKIYALAYVNNYLKQCLPGLVFGTPIHDIPRSPLAIRLIRRAYAEAFKLLMTLHQPDVVHETFFYAKRLVPKRTKVVITVHDMIHEKFQHRFPQMYQDWGGDKGRRLKAECLQKADHIICVSESAKQDVIEMLGISSDRLSVVYNGGSMLKASPATASPAADPAPLQIPTSASIPPIPPSIPKLPTPFLLFVGQRQWYKNFQGLLQVFSQSPKLLQAFQIVCFGGKPFSAEERQWMADLHIPESKVIRITGDDDTLIQLYQQAAALVYPSLYEGFGIPPLEAMSFNCPVVCSNQGSLPEVVGTAAEFFDPDNLEAFRAALEAVVDSPLRRAELIQLGQLRSQQFSWDTCAQETHAIYQALAA